MVVALMVVAVTLVAGIWYFWSHYDQEHGDLVLVELRESGYTRYRYDRFAALFDTKNLYYLDIEESHSGMPAADNHLSAGRAQSVFEAVRKASTRNFASYDAHAYTVLVGRMTKLNDTEYENILAELSGSGFAQFNDSYYNQSAPTDGETTHITAKIDSGYKTVSDYAGGAPEGYRTVETLMESIVAEKFGFHY